MARESQEIIERIELTREDIGRTAEALADRLTVLGLVRPSPNGGPRRGTGISRWLPASRAGRVLLALLAGLVIGRLSGRRRRRSALR